MKLLTDLPSGASERLADVIARRLDVVLGRDVPVPIAFTGVELRAARLSLGLNAAEAAEVIGCHENTVYSVERGATVPRPGIVRRSMAAFIDEANRRLESP